jgi:hypothetical protein
MRRGPLCGPSRAAAAARQRAAAEASEVLVGGGLARRRWQTARVAPWDSRGRGVEGNLGRAIYSENNLKFN